jgi:hypothetical protein
LTLTQDLACEKIGKLVDKYRGLSEDARKHITEAGVVHQFIDPLLEALGWPDCLAGWGLVCGE